MISIILAKKIISLFLIMLIGYILVKVKLLKSQDSRILSQLSLYVMMPCAILMAFQVKFTSDVKKGLLLSFIGAVFVYLIFFVAGACFKHFLHLDEIEYTSILYSNASSLIIPIVTSVLGTKWIIYTSGMVSIQIFLLWSHAKSSICGVKGIEIKKLISNINLIAIAIGILFLLFGIQFPSVIEDSIVTTGNMIGPMSMIITGMLIANMDFKQIVTYKRVWKVTFLRLIVFPLLLILFFHFSGLKAFTNGGKTILFITLLANATPTASTIMQMAQIYDKDAYYASVINVVSTVCCLITMPFIVFLYQMFS